MTDSRRILGTIAVSLVAFAAGALVGVVTTFTHRQLPPWGLLVGLAIIAALLIGIRLAFPSRVAAVAASLGVVGAVVVLLQQTGGSLLIVDDVLGWVWALGPAAIAALVMVWPRRRRRPEASSEEA